MLPSTLLFYLSLTITTTSALPIYTYLNQHPLGDSLDYIPTIASSPQEQGLNIVPAPKSVIALCRARSIRSFSSMFCDNFIVKSRDDKCYNIKSPFTSGIRFVKVKEPSDWVCRFYRSNDCNASRGFELSEYLDMKGETVLPAVDYGSFRCDCRGQGHC